MPVAASSVTIIPVPPPPPVDPTVVSKLCAEADEILSEPWEARHLRSPAYHRTLVVIGDEDCAAILEVVETYVNLGWWCRHRTDSEYFPGQARTCRMEWVDFRPDGSRPPTR